uniref:Macro domain-containing protein n=1 Tax=Monopterus albus TaxID=43700 RepID=A0A3Q3JX14_MONAL
IGWKLNYVTGDLFSCPKTESLAHCISEDCRMGAGIALTFRRRFGRVNHVMRQRKRTGECGVLKDGDRYLYYLVTKQRVTHRPRLTDLKASLERMKAHCLENGVKNISMPRIGCGLDRLKWKDVSAAIETVFGATDIAITVYTLPAPGSYAARDVAYLGYLG